MGDLADYTYAWMLVAPWDRNVVHNYSSLPGSAGPLEYKLYDLMVSPFHGDLSRRELLLGICTGAGMPLVEARLHVSDLIAAGPLEDVY